MSTEFIVDNLEEQISTRLVKWLYASVHIYIYISKRNVKFRFPYYVVLSSDPRCVSFALPAPATLDASCPTLVCFLLEPLINSPLTHLLNPRVDSISCRFGCRQSRLTPR